MSTISKGTYSNMLKISYFLFLTYSLIGHIPVFSTVLKYGTFIGIALLILNFIYQYTYYTFKELCIYILLLAILLVHSYYSGNYGFFKLMMFAGSLKNADMKQIIKFDMYLRTALIIIVVLLCNAGIAEDVSFSYNGVVRRSMGFTNPNTLGIAVFVLVCDALYTYNMKLNLKVLAFISAFSVWLYSVARCRTAVYAIIALLIVSLVYTLSPKVLFSKPFKIICYIAPILLSLITLIVVRQYMDGNSSAVELNELLSGRIHSIARFAKVLSPTLFGQPIGETIDHSLDNTYGFIWYDLGIIVFVLFFFAYFKLLKNNFKAGNAPMCVIILAFMFYGLSEHLWINVDYNIFMLAFCYNPLALGVDTDDSSDASQIDTEGIDPSNIKITG